MDTQLQAVKVVTHGTSDKVMRRAAAGFRNPTPHHRAVPSLSGKGLSGPCRGWTTGQDVGLCPVYTGQRHRVS